MRRRSLAALAVLLGGLGLTGLAAPGPRAQAPVTEAGAGLIARGRALFVNGCSSCHGLDARGRPQQGPSLVGVGAAAADFYLSTGRMPLDTTGDEPVRFSTPARHSASCPRWAASFDGQM